MEYKGAHTFSDVIDHCKSDLVNHIQLRNNVLWEKLIEMRLYTSQDVEEIKDKHPSQRDQVREILRVVQTRGYTQYQNLRRALAETGQLDIVHRCLPEIKETPPTHQPTVEGLSLSRWQCVIARRYNRTLDEFPLYELTDDPNMVSLRHLYTRTEITDTTGWPRFSTQRIYDDYSSMFIKDDVCRKRVLLLGSPGMGKSILGHHMALNWCDIVNEGSMKDANDFEKDHPKNQEEKEFLQQFALLLHIDLSKIGQNSSLDDVISEQILVDERVSIQQFIRYVTLYQENCMIILDAWDEYNTSLCVEVTDIANGQKFPDATVLINSRIKEHTVLPKSIDAQCMIRGFNQDQANKFTEKILFNSKTSADALFKHMNNSRLWGPFSSPLILTYFCLLHDSGSPLKDKVTDLFLGIIKLSLGRHKLKKRKVYAADVEVDLGSLNIDISKLGKLAYSGLQIDNTRTVFTKSEAVKIGGENIIDVGLLHKVKSQNPLSPSCLLTFGHKSIQEFVAAVYISNSEQAFSVYLKHLDSLIRIYDNQLLVAFLCGLNSTYGHKIIQKIQEISEVGESTAAECPAFSSRGWFTETPGLDELAWREAATTTDVSPFLIQCCSEMTHMDKSPYREGYPFTHGVHMPAIKLKPNINMKLINLDDLSRMLELGIIVFIGGNVIKLYNMLNNEENEENVHILLDNISENVSEISVLDIANMKSNIKSKTLTKLLNISFKHIYLKNVDMLQSTILTTVYCLSHQKILVLLHLENITLKGCEGRELCDTVLSLISLKALYFKSMSFKGCEILLCEAISHLHHLQLLSLYNVNMSNAGDALLDCLSKLSLVTYLSLGNNLDAATLSSDQTRRVVLYLLTRPMVLLNIQSLANGAINELQLVLTRLTNLKWLDIQHGRLKSQQLFSVLKSLPSSVQVVLAKGNDTDDSVICVIQLLPALPNLRYLSLSLSNVANVTVQQLKAAFCQTEAELISTDNEHIQPMLATILLDIRREYE